MDHWTFRLSRGLRRAVKGRDALLLLDDALSDAAVAGDVEWMRRLHAQGAIPNPKGGGGCPLARSLAAWGPDHPCGLFLAGAHPGCWGRGEAMEAALARASSWWVAVLAPMLDFRKSDGLSTQRYLRRLVDAWMADKEWGRDATRLLARGAPAELPRMCGYFGLVGCEELLSIALEEARGEKARGAAMGAALRRFAKGRYHDGLMSELSEEMLGALVGGCSNKEARLARVMGLPCEALGRLVDARWGAEGAARTKEEGRWLARAMENELIHQNIVGASEPSIAGLYGRELSGSSAAAIAEVARTLGATRSFRDHPHFQGAALDAALALMEWPKARAAFEKSGLSPGHCPRHGARAEAVELGIAMGEGAREGAPLEAARPKATRRL
jgi:hypothetical protein